MLIGISNPNDLSRGLPRHLPLHLKEGSGMLDQSPQTHASEKIICFGQLKVDLLQLGDVHPPPGLWRQQVQGPVQLSYSHPSLF